MAPGRDLTGQSFGRLTVLGASGTRDGRFYWKCVCECGRLCETGTWQLTSGHTKSCGCYRRQLPQTRTIDLTGRRFGRLTVIRRYPGKEDEKPRGTYWYCVCDCGQSRVCSGDRLRRGSVKSCGCLQSEQRSLNMRRAIHFVDGTCIERISESRTGSNNTSGKRGVYLRKSGRWRAMIGFRGRLINLGTFECFEDAAAARDAAERELYAPVVADFRKGGRSGEERRK